MRALITGGAGFAGSHLAEFLLQQNQEVIALTRVGENLGNLAACRSNIRIVQGDIRDKDRLLQLLGEVKPQRIYHLAAFTDPQKSLRDPNQTYEVNFVGTLNLLLAWRTIEFDCRFLFVSSPHVYGRVRADTLPLREDVPFNPDSPYGASKAAGELLALQFFHSYGLPAIRVRPFNHTGPRQPPEFVCSALARQVAEIDLDMREPAMKVGNLEVKRDFTDVRDIVRGYAMLLEGGKPGEVYQLSSGQPVSIARIIEILTGLLSKPVSVEIEPSRLRPSDSPAVWGDPSKAERAVGWIRRYPLEVTLGDLKAYWKEMLSIARPL